MNVEPSFLFRLLIPLRRLLPDEITASTLQLILSYSNLKNENADQSRKLCMTRLNFNIRFYAFIISQFYTNLLKLLKITSLSYFKFKLRPSNCRSCVLFSFKKEWFFSFLQILNFFLYRCFLYFLTNFPFLSQH